MKPVETDQSDRASVQKPFCARPGWLAASLAFIAAFIVILLGAREQIAIDLLAWRAFTVFLSIFSTQRLVLAVLALPDPS